MIFFSFGRILLFKITHLVLLPRFPLSNVRYSDLELNWENAVTAFNSL